MKNLKKLSLFATILFSYATILAAPIIGLANSGLGYYNQNEQTWNCEKDWHWCSVRAFNLKTDFNLKDRALLFDVEEGKDLVITIPMIHMKIAPKLFVNGKMDVPNDILLDKEISSELSKRLKMKEPGLLTIKKGNYAYTVVKDKIVLRLKKHDYVGHVTLLK